MSENRIEILKIGVNVTNTYHLTKEVKQWAGKPVGRYICVSNVHMCMESFDDVKIRNIVNNADYVVPDGLPLVWAQKLLGFGNASQVRGYDLTMAVCGLAQKEKLKVGFFGSSPEVLEQMQLKLKKLFPELEIAFCISPPFGTVSELEDQQYIKEIDDSGIKILFVGLGCPKQEAWMHDHREVLHCTMIGVGAVFDFLAGNKKEAPVFIQRMGLEWLFRFVSEPRRLWKRYLKHNPRFLYYFGIQYCRHRFGG